MEDARSFARRVAQQAGEILLAHWRKLRPESVSFKGVRDPVTTADLESEHFIASQIRAAFPDDALLAEEAGGAELRTGRVWIVDPLDGTVNFSHGHPYFAVSIALVEDGEPVASAIHLPALAECLSAARGEGAWRHRAACPDERLHTSRTARLIDALVATGFPYVRDRSPFNNIDAVHRLFLRVRDLRRCGAASIDLAYVAAGHYDGYWEPHLAPHDVAAGILLVREAGGLVTDYLGGGDCLYGRNLVASNGHIHAILLDHMDAGFDAALRVEPGMPVPGSS